MAAAAFPGSIAVLIADDEPLFAEMLHALLAAEGLEVVAKAEDGEEAVRLAAEHDPDVILMDVNMPGMDGIEATRAIREQNPNACILILTGGTTTADIAKARQAGAAGYLTKDKVGSELIAEIRELGGR